MLNNFHILLNQLTIGYILRNLFKIFFFIFELTPYISQY